MSTPFAGWLDADPEVARLIEEETDRQSTTLQLIASENFTSPAVLAASGSVLTNKYSEGYPGRRYYGGNRVIDEVEDLARERAKSLFGAEHANVQPHAGANANLAAYQALLDPGDTVLAMRLDHGGHLTHGSPASITSKIWRFVSYGVTPASTEEDPDHPGEVIDFDQVADLAKREQPHADRGRLDGLLAGDRPRPLPGDRRLGRRLLHVRRRPPGRPDRRGGPPEPGRGGRRRHLHHPQDPARPARRGHPVPGRAGQEGRQRRLPRPPGRSARARDRGQGGGLRRSGRDPSSPTTPTRVVANARALAAALAARGVPAGVGGDRQSHAPGRPAALRRRAHGQGGPGGARPVGHHLQPQHDPRRPALARSSPPGSGWARPPRPRPGWVPQRWGASPISSAGPFASGPTRRRWPASGPRWPSSVPASRRTRASPGPSAPG